MERSIPSLVHRHYSRKRSGSKINLNDKTCKAIECFCLNGTWNENIKSDLGLIFDWMNETHSTLINIFHNSFWFRQNALYIVIVFFSLTRCCVVSRFVRHFELHVDTHVCEFKMCERPECVVRLHLSGPIVYVERENLRKMCTYKRV